MFWLFFTFFQESGLTKDGNRTPEELEIETEALRDDVPLPLAHCVALRVDAKEADALAVCDDMNTKPELVDGFSNIQAPAAAFAAESYSRM